jgi:hypothetical protein
LSVDEGQIRNAGRSGRPGSQAKRKTAAGNSLRGLQSLAAPSRPCPDAALALWITVAGSANANPAANLEAQSTVCASEFAAVFFV